MKKTLLIGAALIAGASSAMAVQQTYPDVALTAVSSDGTWIAGQIDDGSVMIENTATGARFTYFTDEQTTNYYVGSGSTPISDNGTLVGSTTGNNASYWENGVWTDLSIPNPEFMSNACSITPDGSIICGGVGMDELSLDAKNIMLVPAIWVRRSDGTFSDPILLPHPDEDLTGRTPQYITATSISADGNTIAGQIRDFVGFIEEPIVYTRADNGEWSYRRLYPELIRNADVEFPEWPGDLGIEMPVEEQFMTDEEIEAYMAAIDDYYEDPSGKLYPEYTDFMTQDEIDAYTKAYSEYLEVAVPWQRQYDAFNDVYSRILDEGYIFLFNNVNLTPDGKYYTTTREIAFIDDPLDGPRNTYYPVRMNVDGSGYIDLNGSEDTSLLMTSVAADGSVLATYQDPDYILPPRAYVFPRPANGAEAVPLETYLGATNPALASWMEDNMYQSVMYLTPLGTIGYMDYMCSGRPICTPDFSTMLCYTSTDTWDFAEFYYVTWLFSTGLQVDAVDSVADDGYAVVALGNGALDVRGDFLSLDIYNLSGARVYAAKHPAGTLSTGLPAGVYVVRAVAADGSSRTLKTVL